MAVEKGIVTYYDGEYGEIKEGEDKFIFLKKDILSELSVGAYVSFRAEEVQGIKKAYFVKNLENIKSPDDKNKQKIVRG